MPVVSAIGGPREIRAAVLAMKKADKEIRRDVSKRMRETFNPIWKQTIAQNMGGISPADDMVLKGARIRAGNPPALIAGNSKRRYGRDLKPVRDWHLPEYGMDIQKVTYDRTSPKGNRHQVTRRIGTGWPKRTRNGRILGPAIREILPRITSFWVQTVKRTWIEAAESR